MKIPVFVMAGVKFPDIVSYKTDDTENGFKGESIMVSHLTEEEALVWADHMKRQFMIHLGNAVQNKETMTIEVLLVPRYRVIATFPGMKETYSHSLHDTLMDDGIHAVVNRNGAPVFAVIWHEYPHIYREMGWWEERLEADMPAYVKWDDKETKPAPYVRKIKSHFTHTPNQFVSEDGGNYVYSPFLPATEEEYLNQ